MANPKPVSKAASGRDLTSMGWGEGKGNCWKAEVPSPKQELPPGQAPSGLHWPCPQLTSGNSITVRAATWEAGIPPAETEKYLGDAGVSDGKIAFQRNVPFL